MKPVSFTAREEIAALTAKMLIDIKAVHFKADEPYRLTSGLASPVYIDCRKLISFPRIRSTLMDFAVSTVMRDAGVEKFQGVAGGETAGIPFSAFIADRMELPMQYVRKKPKGFGRNAQIEGEFAEGQNILLVEDLATDGGSKHLFIDALRKAGAEVTDTFVVFFYDVFKGSREALRAEGVELHSLATWRDVLKVARDGAYFDEATLNSVADFLDDPLAWSKAHGGVDSLPSLNKG